MKSKSKLYLLLCFISFMSIPLIDTLFSGQWAFISVTMMMFFFYKSLSVNYD